jgi:hypothetical protein
MCSALCSVPVAGLEHVNDKDIAVVVLKAALFDYSTDTMLPRPYI